MLDKILGWQFLNEPALKWFIFFGLLIVIAFLWRVILNTID